jgi:hypothetical protein
MSRQTTSIFKNLSNNLLQDKRNHKEEDKISKVKIVLNVLAHVM